MYHYLVDQGSMKTEKFERKFTELQGLLTEYRVAGEISRTSSLRSLGTLTETIKSKNLKTLVACGNDETFQAILQAMRGLKVTLAYIPLEDKSALANTLGFKGIKEAVAAIASRKYEQFDLASIGNNIVLTNAWFGFDIQNHSFLQKLKNLLSSSGVNYSFQINNSYTLTAPCIGGCIVNIREELSPDSNIGNPTDGQLDLLLLHPLSLWEKIQYIGKIHKGLLESIPNTTAIKCTQLSIESPENVLINTNEKHLGYSPIEAKIISETAQIIVGKGKFWREEIN